MRAAYTTARDQLNFPYPSQREHPYSKGRELRRGYQKVKIETAFSITILGIRTITNEAGGQEKTLPTLPKSLTCARVRYN